MKIIYVHSGSFPSSSPSITFTSNTVNSLAQEVDKCYFFVKKNSHDSPEMIFNKLLNLDKSEKLSIKSIEVLFNQRFNSIYYWQVYFNILKISQSEKISAIITRNVTFLPFLFKLRKKLACKIYFESHDFFTDLTLRNDINIKNKLKQQSIEQRYLPHIDGIFCLTQTQIQLYSKYYPKTRLFLARTGLSIQTASPLNQRKYLGYVGSLDLHKGILNLLKIASLSQHKPEVVVVGAKNEAEKNTFLERVKGYYDVSKITVYLWQDKKSLNKILDQVKVGFVTLSDTFFNNYLTSPLKIFDYLSKEIPVIGSKLPTIQEVVFDNKNGFLYELGKEDEIARKLDILMSDEKLYKKFQLNIINQAKDLTWKKRAEIIVKSIAESSAK